MTKLPPNGEKAIRWLDDMDDAGDVEDLDREPCRSRLSEWWSSSREVLAYKALRGLGLLEHFSPRKLRPGVHRHRGGSLEFALDDLRRLKDIWPRQRRGDKVTIALIAAERHRRHLPHDGIWGQQCTVDELGAGGEEEVELLDLAAKLDSRRRRGTTGAERYRRAKLRAK